VQSREAPVLRLCITPFQKRPWSSEGAQHARGIKLRGSIMLSVLSHAEMHTDHQQWVIEEVLWEDDARVWRNEIDAALVELKKLESFLRDERASLDAYAETIHGLRLRRASHESALADYEQGGCEEALIAMARKHEQEAEKHLNQRHAHERIKHHHHTVMAYWRLLFKAFAKAT
jgi:hypothetical protein